MDPATESEDGKTRELGQVGRRAVRVWFAAAVSTRGGKPASGWDTDRWALVLRVRVTIDGVVKDAALDLYAGARTTRAYRSYAGLTNTRHTLVVTVLGQRRTGATGTYATVDAVSTGTSGCTSTTGCSYTPGGYRWTTGAFSPGALGGRVSGSDVPGATATRTFVGTGFDLVRLVGPGQGQLRLYVDGAAVATVNSYATRNGLAAVTRTGLRSGTHTVTVQVLHQTGRAGTSAFAVTLDRLVAR